MLLEICAHANLCSQLLLQGEDWRSTDMAAAVETFHSCFLDALQSEARSSLAAKVRDSRRDGLAF